MRDFELKDTMKEVPYEDLEKERTEFRRAIDSIEDRETTDWMNEVNYLNYDKYDYQYK